MYIQENLLFGVQVDEFWQMLWHVTTTIVKTQNVSVTCPPPSKFPLAGPL